MKERIARESAELSGRGGRDATLKEQQQTFIKNVTVESAHIRNALGLLDPDFTHVAPQQFVRVAQVNQTPQSNQALPPAAGNGPSVKIQPGPNGVVTLPAGKIATIQASGGDLRIVLDDGRVFVVQGGVDNPPAIQINGQTIAGTSLAAVFGPIQEVQPAAGDGAPPSSGNNFETQSTTIDQAFQFSGLLGREGLNEAGEGNEEDNDFFDDAPTVGDQVEFSLDEDALDGNIVNTGAATVYSGTLNLNYGANGINLVAPITFDAASLNGLYTSGGNPVVFTWDQSTMTLTGSVNGTPIFVLQITDAQAGTFTATLSGPFDQSGLGRDGLPIALQFVVRDSNGTETPGVLNIVLTDDVPVANEIQGATTENANVIVVAIDGLGGDFYSGADGLGSFSINTGEATISGPAGVPLALPGIALTSVTASQFELAITPGTAFDALAVGEVATLTVPYTVIDGDGDQITNYFVITITGTNDVPVISGISQTSLTEQTNTAPLNATIAVTFTDVDYNDVGHTAEVTQVTTAGQTGGLALDQAALIALVNVGTVTKSAGSSAGAVDLNFSAPFTAFNYLAAGEVVTLTYTLAIDDHDGGVATQTFTVKITGTNDVPVITAGTGNLVEKTDHTLDFSANSVSGFLNFTDADWNDTGHTAQVISVSRSGESDGLLSPLLGGNILLMSQLSVSASKAAGTDAGKINWTYSAPDAQYDYLAKGQTVTLTYTIRLNDGDGGITTQTLAITVTGTNDRPIFSPVDARIGVENLDSTGSTALETFSGVIGFADADRDDVGHSATVTAFNATGTTVGLNAADVEHALSIGAVTKAANSVLGTVAWSFSAQDKAFDYLAAGETVTLAYTVTLNDNEGETNSTDTTTIYITIVGTNDRPVIGAGNDAAAITELANMTGSGTDRTATGNFAFTDVDLTDAHTTSVALTGSSWSGGSIDPSDLAAFTNAMSTQITNAATGDGTGNIKWDFKVDDSALDFLSRNETLTLTYTVTLSDDSGTGNSAAATKAVTITITGRNDVPVIEATVADLLEKTDHTLDFSANSVSGSMAFTDVDLNDTGHTAQVISVSRSGESDGLLSPLLGGNLLLMAQLSVSASKAAGTDSGQINWTYSAPDAQYDYLAKGQTVTLTYTIRLNDGDGGITTQTLAITVTGTNDRPIFSPVDARIGVENLGSTGSTALETFNGVIGFSDADRDDVGHTATVTGFGASGTTTGLNAADVQNALSIGAVTKAANSVLGTVAWSFSAQDKAFDYLGEGETVTLAYTVTLNDNEGETNSTDTTTIYITIVGTNDRPVIVTGNQSAPLTEFVAVTGSGSLQTSQGVFDFVDADLTDAHVATVSLTGAVWSDGSIPTSTASAIASAMQVSITDSATGDGAGKIGWNFSLADSNLDFLAAGETLTLTYTVGLKDDALLNGTAASKTVTITITGTNDKPVIAATSTANLQITEVADLAAGETTTVHTVDGSTAFQDVDLTDTHSASAVAGGSGYVGTFTTFIQEDSTGDGTGTLSWSFSVQDSAIEYLREGQELVQTYTITVDDGNGGTATIDVTVTMAGTNDLPTVSAVPVPRVDEDGGLAGGIAGGTGDVVAGLDVSGSLNIVWGADDFTTPGGSTVDGDVRFTGVTSDAGSVLAPAGTSRGETINVFISTDGDTAVGYAGTWDGSSLDTNGLPSGVRIVFVATVNEQGSGSYTFQLRDTIDHAAGGDENDARLTFALEVVDSDAAVVPHSFSVDVNDDSPTASFSNPRTLSEDTNPDGSFKVAAVNGTFTFGGGADGATVTSIAIGQTTTVFNGVDSDASSFTRVPLKSHGEAINVVSEDGGLRLIGKLADGTEIFRVQVTNPATGAYTFTLSGPIDHPDIGEGGDADRVLLYVSFTVTDRDGDTATQHTQLHIRDDVPTVSANAAVVLDDDALTGGNAGGTGDDTNAVNVSGTLSHDFGADGGSIAWLTSGNPSGFTYETGSNGKLLIKQDGVTVIEVTLDSATGAYTVTQVAPVKHAAGSDENNQDFTLTYRVTDRDGDFVDGTLAISVDDDTPTVRGGHGVREITVNESEIADAASYNWTTQPSANPSVKMGADGVGSIAFTGYLKLDVAPGFLEGNVSFDLTAGTGSTPKLKSQGVDVTFAQIDAQTIIGYAGSPSNIVIELKLVGANVTTTILGPLDHISAHDGSQLNAIIVDARIRFTDGDGDSVETLIRTTVNDDVPTAQAVVVTGSEDTLTQIVLVGDGGADGLEGFIIKTLPTNGALFSDAAGTIPVVVGTTVQGPLYFQPAANWNGQTAFTYVALDGDTDESALATVTVNISAVNDAPTLINVANMSTNEDTTVYFSQAATWISNDPDRADGMAPSLTLTLNVDSGEGVLSASQNGLSGGFNIVSSNGGKTLTITTFADTGPGAWRDAHHILNSLLRGDNFGPGNQNGIAFTPNPNWSGPVSISYTLSDNGWSGAGGAQTATGSFSITVNPIADQPNLAVAPAQGDEDTAIALSISASLTDTDGSETLALTVDGIPVGAKLSDGTNTFIATSGSTTANITGWDLSSLKITPPANSDVDFDLTVKATSTDGSSTSSVQQTLSVQVDPVADAPIVNVASASGNEDTSIPLSISIALTDTDGSETISALVVSGIPVGATITDGANTFTATTGNTSIDINGWNLSTLGITPPANSNVDFTLTVTATSKDGSSLANTVQTLPVVVDAVNDAPNLTNVTNRTTNEDTTHYFRTGIWVASDPDQMDGKVPTVTLTLHIDSGEGVLSASRNGLSGGFTITQSDGGKTLTITTTADGGVGGRDAYQILNSLLRGDNFNINTNPNGIAFTPSPDWNGTASISYTLSDNSNFGSGGALSKTGSFSVTVVPVNDAPVISVEAGDTALKMLTETNAGLTASGTLTATDVDVTDLMNATVVGVTASGANIESRFTSAQLLQFFSLGANPVDSASTTSGKITWTFNSQNEAFDFLPHGFQSAIEYTVRVSDGNGGFDDQVVRIVITGTNDAPVINAMTSQVIVINNGFEADTTYASQQSEGRWTDGNPTGWIVAGPGTGAGWFDPGVPGVGGDPARIETDASHGTNILFLNDGQSATQTLTAVAQAGSYTFSVDVGDREDNGLTGQPSFALRLYAGSTLIGEYVVPAELADGPDWQHVSFNINVPDGAAYLGQQLRIELANLEQQGGGGDFSHITQVNFDNVSLTYTSDMALTSINENDINNGGQTVASILGASVTDVDAGAVEGIAIIGSNDGNGTWQFFNGSNWVDFGSYSETQALLLRATDLVRFVPNGENGTIATFQYVAWDQTGSTAGAQYSTADASSRGGTTPYSTDTAQAKIVVTSVNDAPVINEGASVLAGSVRETGDLASIDEAGFGGGLEPKVVLTNDSNAALSSLQTAPAGIATVVQEIQNQQSVSLPEAIAIVWDYLDDNYVSSGPNQPNVNEAFARLGVIYASFVKAGGMSFLDIIAKYTADDGDTNFTPERLQSLHDNLLGNLTTAALLQRWGSDPVKYAQIEALINAVDPALLTRPYYEGSEGSSDAAVRAWDMANGYVPAATGTILASDVDAGSTLTFSGDAAGSYGNFTITSGGVWTYKLDNTLGSTQSLAQGETATETFTVTVTDNTGLTDTTQVVITITGTNDAPFIEGGQSKEFSQNFNVDSAGMIDGGSFGTIAVVASGTDGIVTADGSSYAQVKEAGGSGAFTRFDGYQTAWTGNWSAEVKVYLDVNWAAGEGFEYSVASGNASGGHLRDFIFHVVKDTSTGELIVAASNNSNFAPREDLENLNHYEVSSSGWYTLRHVFNNVGGVLSVDLQLVDANGTVLWSETRSNPADLIPSVVGGNRYGWFTDVTLPNGVAVDGITINRAGTGAAIVEFAEGNPNEGVDTHTASGTLPFSDVDATDTHSVSFTPAGSGYVGTFTPVIGDDTTGDGKGQINWTFNVNDSAIENLAQGQTLTQTYAVTVNDGKGGTDTVNVTVTITGTNDAPVITGGQTSASVTEFGDLPGITEATGGANLEPAAAVVLSGPVNTALDGLLTAPANVAGTLALVQGDLGVNLPTAIAIVWEYLDDSYVGAGPNQPNVNEAFARLGVEYAKYLAAGGTPLMDVTAKYTPDGADADLTPERLQSLHDNLLGNLTTYALTQRWSSNLAKYGELEDLIEAVNPALLNRPYYEGGDDDGAALVAARAFDQAQGYLPVATGTLTASDVDNGASLTWSGTANGTYGTFAIDANTGQWTYRLDNTRAATQALKQGEVVTDSFTATVTDQFGASDATTVSITITGTNDAPVFSSAFTAAAGTEDTQYTITQAQLQNYISQAVSDVDTSLSTISYTLTVKSGAITVATFSFTGSVPGDFSFTPPANFNGSLSASLTANDGYATTTTNFTIAIAAVNDAPVINEGASVLAGSVRETGDLASIDEAGLGGGLEPRVVLTNDSNAALSSLQTAPAGIATVVQEIQNQQSVSLPEAIAIVWDYLDDNYVSSGPNQPNVNEAFARLGVIYASFVKAGGMSFLDIIAKYTADGGDAGSNPDRLQSLHDNLLGNLTTAALLQRWGSDPVKYAQIEALINAVDPALLTRPYYEGSEGSSDAAVRAWDMANGYVPAATGTIVASDVDAGSTLTFSGDATGTYGKFTVTSGGVWTYKLDNTLGATQSLSQGETKTETFTVTVTDNTGLTDTTQVVITVTGTNDAPVITGGQTSATVFESGSLDAVVQANEALNGRFEPLANIDAQIQAALTPGYDIHNVLAAAKAALGPQAGDADAIAAVWDYIDDNYSYYNTAINALGVRLGIAYAEYLQAGGRPLTDVVVKYTADGGDSGSNPDRLQSLHDNLLGNLHDPSMQDKFLGAGSGGSNPVPDAGLYNTLHAELVAKNLADRPYYGGNEGEANNAAAWDQSHGLLPVASGQLAASDVDTDAVLTWSGSANGTYGNLTVSATGQWSYVLDDSRSATQGLNEGQTVTETFAVRVTDNHGAVDTVNVVITIKGTNDAPVITGGQTSATVFESGSLDAVVQANEALNGRFEPLANIDAQIQAALTPGYDIHNVLAAAKAALGPQAGDADAIAAVWDYIDDNYSYYNTAINALGVRLGIAYAEYLQAGGRPLTDVVVKYTADGGDAGSNPDRLQSLHDNLLGNLHDPSMQDKFLGAGSGGSNPVPDAGLYNTLHAELVAKNLADRPYYGGNEGEANNAAAWDQSHGLLPVASGQLAASDVDTDAVLTWSGSANGTYGNLTVSATGQWSYVLDDSRSATQGLNEGQTVTETFAVRVTDNHGAVDTVNVVITIKGTNDAPVITGGQTSASVTEFGDLPGITEATGGANLEPAAAVVLSGPVNTALDGLLTAPASVAGTLALVQGGLGVNLPTAIAIVWEYLDDSYVGAGPNQPNVNEAFARLGVEYAKYLAAGGTPLMDVTAKYTPDGADADLTPERLQSLHDNLLGNLTTYALTQRWSSNLAKYGELEDLIEAVNPALLNRPYYEGGDDDGAALVAARAFDQAQGYLPVATGTLTASDVDNGASLTWSGTANGTYGTFAIDANTGQWTYRLDNTRAATQALKEGEVVTDSFTATVTDQFGASDATTVSITITGTNDAPVFSSAFTAAAGTEDTQYTITQAQLQNYISQAVSDVDTSLSTISYTLTVKSGAITVATFSFTGSVPGDFSFTPPANFNGSLSASLTANDGYATTTTNFTIAIAAVNDVPVAQDAAFSVSEDGVLSAGVSATDDDGQALTYQVYGTAPAGLVFNADGTFSYTPPASYQSLNDGQSATVQFQYLASDGTANSAPKTVTITIEGATDLPPAPPAAANASPFYAFADDNTPTGKATSINLDLATLFTGQSANTTYLFEPLNDNNGTNGVNLGVGQWNWLSRSGNIISGNPDDNRKGLYIARVTATDTVTGLSAITFVALTVLANGAVYNLITTNNQGMAGATWNGNFVELQEGASVTQLVNSGGPVDVVVGNSGNNNLAGAHDTDAIYGGGGDDTLTDGSARGFVAGGDGNDTIDGQDGDDVLLGEGGNDTIYGGSQNDIILGGAGNDTLYGDSGDDYLDGGDGDDIIYGGSGNDTLIGGAGNDTLYGETGNNVLNGGAGNDTLYVFNDGSTNTLTGGSGDDKFVIEAFKAGNIITDINDGNDIIDLTALFTTMNGQDAFAAGYVDLNGNTLRVDTDGGGNNWQTVLTFSSAPGAVTVLYDQLDGTKHTTVVT